MRESDFEELMTSIDEMQEILAGRLAPGRVTTAKDLDDYWALNAAEVRARWGMSQRKFAQLLGISVDTLQNWEQGRRTPDGPARVLLKVAQKHPEALASVAADALRAKARKLKPRAGLPK